MSAPISIRSVSRRFDAAVALERVDLEVAAGEFLALLDRLAEPAGCRCRALLRPRPPAYARALSPPAPA